MLTLEFLRRYDSFVCKLLWLRLLLLLLRVCVCVRPLLYYTIHWRCIPPPTITFCLVAATTRSNSHLSLSLLLLLLLRFSRLFLFLVLLLLSIDERKHTRAHSSWLISLVYTPQQWGPREVWERRMTFFNLPSPRFSVSTFYAAVLLYLALMAVACFLHAIIAIIMCFFFFELWKNKYFTLVNVDRHQWADKRRFGSLLQWILALVLPSQEALYLTFVKVRVDGRQQVLCTNTFFIYFFFFSGVKATAAHTLHIENWG